jgi:serine/threonine protein phosphatase PrpC
METILLSMKQAIRGPSVKLEDMEKRESRAIPFNAGCTSCVCLVTPDTIYCSNSGDSRAILVSKSGKVTELSHDHKPDDMGEMQRIKAAGGFVDDGRVQGIIAVSRAIGDWEYKNPALLA